MSGGKKSNYTQQRQIKNLKAVIAKKGFTYVNDKMADRALAAGIYIIQVIGHGSQMQVALSDPNQSARLIQLLIDAMFERDEIEKFDIKVFDNTIKDIKSALGQSNFVWLWLLTLPTTKAENLGLVFEAECEPGQHQSVPSLPMLSKDAFYTVLESDEYIANLHTTLAQQDFHTLFLSEKAQMMSAQIYSEHVIILDEDNIRLFFPDQFQGDGKSLQLIANALDEYLSTAAWILSSDIIPDSLKKANDNDDRDQMYLVMSHNVRSFRLLQNTIAFRAAKSGATIELRAMDGEK